jgi:hypothetical protein
MIFSCRHFPRSNALLLAAASVLFTAGFVVWPGCGSIPLRSSRTTPGPVQMKDVKNSAQAGLSKSEVFAKLGKPDAWYDDLRVACYKLNVLNRNSLLIVFFVPIGSDSQKDAGAEVAMIQFDARGVQLRQTRRQIYGGDPEKLLHSEAERWVTGKNARGEP